MLSNYSKVPDSLAPEEEENQVKLRDIAETCLLFFERSKPSQQQVYEFFWGLEYLRNNSVAEFFYINDSDSVYEIFVNATE